MMQGKTTNGVKHINQIIHPEELIPDTDQITIKKENILAAMGMQASQADDYVLGLIDEFTEQSREISHPLAGFAIVDHPLFNKEKHVLVLNDIELNPGKMVTSYLRNSSYMAVFVATCGEKVEQLSKQLFADGHMLEGYLVDLRRNC